MSSTYSQFHSQNSAAAAPKGIMKFFTQSTIYKRNEARMAKRRATNSRDAPAAIRVLSAMSQPRLKSQPVISKGSTQLIASMAPGFSEETVFMTSSELLEMYSSSTENPKPAPLSTAFLLTSFGGAASRVVFGPRSSAPIFASQHSQEAKMAQLAFEGSAAQETAVKMSMFGSVPSHNRLPTPVATPVPLPEILASAAMSGLLFGSKIAFSRSLDETDNQPWSLPFMVTSALAGAAKASLSVPLQSIRSLQLTSPRPIQFSDAFSMLTRNHGLQGLYSGSRTLFSGEMMGAVVYFSTYESIKTALAPTSDGKATPSLVIGLSGAISGVVYQFAMHTFLQSQRQMTVQSMLGAQNRIFSPSLARSMPIHATLFLCYESAKVASNV